MYFFYYIAIIVAVSVGVSDSAVVEYTDENFTANMANNAHSFVAFYETKCTVCDVLKILYKKAEELATHLNRDVKFVTVNCETTGANTCKTYNVTEVPRLKYFANGTLQEECKGNNSGDMLKCVAAKLLDKGRPKRKSCCGK